MNHLFMIIDPITNLITGDEEIGFLWQVLIRVILSISSASILGIERANKRHAAGLRTFIIASLAATISALIDSFLMKNFEITMPFMSAATVVGLAIISSYTILYSSKNQIKGLTTAVALWGQAFVGFSLGFGIYTLALVSSVLLVISLSALPNLEIHLKNRSNHFEIHLELKNKSNLADFVQVIRNLGLYIDDIEANPAYHNTGLSVYTISLSIYSKELKKYKTHSEIIEALKSIDYISHIEEIS